MTKRRKLACGLIGGALLALAATSQIGHASDSPTDLRQAGMKSMAKSLKVMKQAIDKNGDKADIAAAAQTIVDVSAQIPGWFPKDAGKGQSAKPEIWDNWDQFTADAKNLNDQASKMVAAAKDGQDANALGGQFQNIGKACGTCHESFRAKD